MTNKQRVMRYIKSVSVNLDDVTFTISGILESPDLYPTAPADTGLSPDVFFATVEDLGEDLGMDIIGMHQAKAKVVADRLHAACKQGGGMITITPNIFGKIVRG